MKEVPDHAKEAFQCEVDLQLRKRPETDLMMPHVAPDYPEIAARLLVAREDGVSVFFGGPLDHSFYGSSEAWLTPVEVKDAKGFTNFHVVYLNCTPKTAENINPEISYARTIDLKTGNVNDPETQKLHGNIKNGDSCPKVVIRPSLIGSLYYPQVSTQLFMPSAERVAKRIEKLANVFNFSLNRRSINLDALREMTKSFEVWAEYPQFFLGTPEKINSESGSVHMYPIVSPDDPWQFYQLFVNQPLERINKRAETTLRTDSGCDNGQLYLDLGCDCREQFQIALSAIQKCVHADDGGIVLHIPLQDGRGYGTNTKLDTEGMKRGVRMVHNQNDNPVKPLDTVTAAKQVFGKKYDIRTYDGAARILSQLGFTTVRLLTDNRRKHQDLLDAGINVIRMASGTKGNGVDDRHLKAKHDSGDYYPDQPA